MFSKQNRIGPDPIRLLFVQFGMYFVSHLPERIRETKKHTRQIQSTTMAIHTPTAPISS